MRWALFGHLLEGNLLRLDMKGGRARPAFDGLFQKETEEAQQQKQEKSSDIIPKDE